MARHPAATEQLVAARAGLSVPEGTCCFFPGGGARGALSLEPCGHRRWPGPTAPESTEGTSVACSWILVQSDKRAAAQRHLLGRVGAGGGDGPPAGQLSAAGTPPARLISQPSVRRAGQQVAAGAPLLEALRGGCSHSSAHWSRFMKPWGSGYFSPSPDLLGEGQRTSV